MCKLRPCGLLRWQCHGIYMGSLIVGETPLVLFSLSLIARSFIQSRKEGRQGHGVVGDTINRWSAKRYNHLSYMHNEERNLMHITILVMAIPRVYYVGAFFYTHKEHNALLNKTAKKCQKKIEVDTFQEVLYPQWLQRSLYKLIIFMYKTPVTSARGCSLLLTLGSRSVVVDPSKSHQSIP